MMLSEMERTVTNKLTCNFQFYILKLGFFMEATSRRICLGRRHVALQSRSNGFPVQILVTNFASFQAPIKSLPFALRT